MGRGINLLAGLSYVGLGLVQLSKAMGGGALAEAPRQLGRVGRGRPAPPSERGAINFQRMVEVFAKEAGTAKTDKRFWQEIHHVDINRIDGKIRVISEIVRAGAKHPLIIQLKNEILTRRCRAANEKTGDGGWCTPEKDWEKELVALFNWIRANVRYTRDPSNTDLFSAPEQTLLMKAGDCDDYTSVLGALLMSSGQLVRARVIQTTDAPSFNHIYLLTNPAGDGKGKWVPLDASVAKPAGWEAPGASQCAKTGKPAGMVAVVRDFDL